MEGTQSTMSRSYLRKSKDKHYPPCLPDHSHYWRLECAQDAAADGRLGQSRGQCDYCGVTFTFINDIYDQRPELKQQLNLENGFDTWNRHNDTGSG